MAQLQYHNLDPAKKAFVFELGNVLYPEKDYLYQVYYLFANLLEYTELNNAAHTTNIMIKAYIDKGRDAVYDELKAAIKIDERFRQNLDILIETARVPLKLLLYQNILELLQAIVLDRKKIFIVTNGNPQEQLNKIKQLEWHGLQPYLVCYFANEIKPKPQPDVLELLIKDHNLQKEDLLMIENTETDRLCAQATGIDCLNVKEFL